MQFLFNDVVFQMHDPVSALDAAACPISSAAAQRLPMGELGKLLREAAFERPNLARETPDKACALAALIVLRTGANAVLLVCPEGARSADDVLLRFAEVSLHVIANLAAQQAQGKLSARTVDKAVWSSSP